MPFMAALLFAVHPVHVEAVTGIVGRAELLSSIFFLLALLSYKRASLSLLNKSLFACALFVTLATFSKEQGITVLGVCFIYEVLIVQKLDVCSVIKHFPSPFHAYSTIKFKKCPNVGLRPMSVRTFWLIVIGALLLGLRFSVMSSTLPVFTNFDNPASYESAPVKQLTWFYLVAINVWLLLNPADLCCDWTMGTIPLVRTISDPRNLATLFTFMLLAHLSISGLLAANRKERNLVGLSLGMTALPFLPASNLFFPVGFVVAERVLYLPSMGFCLLVAYGFRRLYCNLPKARKCLRAAFYSLVLLHLLKTFMRNFDWQDEMSIFISGLKVITSGMLNLLFPNNI